MAYPMVNHSREKAIRERANGAFESAWRQGQLHRLWALLTGASRQPLYLDDVRDRYDVVGHEKLESQSVRVAQIRGMQSYSDRFDKDFYPLNRRQRDRWVSIAEAMLTDPFILPPVQLVQVGDDYYVLDGNHRVSVAKKLDRIYINADVVRWDVIEK